VGAAIQILQSVAIVRGSESEVFLQRRFDRFHPRGDKNVGFHEIPARKEKTMDIVVLRQFFLWCTIINAALLAVSFLVCVFAADWIHGVHGRWFPMPKETFIVVLYSFLGIYKILFIMFNVVPYAALLIAA
jgi:hypothetical protein